MVKKQKGDLGEEKVRLEQYRIDKDRAERAEMKSRDLHSQVEAMRAQITELDEEIETSWREAQEYFQNASGFEATIAALNGKRQQLVTMQENIDDLLKGLEEVGDSDEDLMSMQRDYETRMRAFEESIRLNEARQVQFSRELAVARRSLEAKLTEQGTAVAEKTVRMSIRII